MTRMGKIIHEKLSGATIGIAMEVLNELNPGLDEILYERAMVIELRRQGHAVAVQKRPPGLEACCAATKSKIGCP